MRYQTKITLFSLFVVMNMMMQTVAEVKCRGRPHLIQGYTVQCLTEYSGRDIDENHSCLEKARDDIMRECMADSCTEINIKLKSGVFDLGADDMVWSFAGCFQKTMEIKVCSEDKTQVPSTTSTTPPSNDTTTAEMTTTTMTESTTSEPSTTTMTTTTMSTTTMTSTPSMSTTTTMSTMSTTTPADPTTTTVTTTEPPVVFSGCYEGEVTFSSNTCSKQSETVTLERDYDNDEVKFEVEVVGCCEEAECRPDDGVTRENTCNFGTNDDVVSVSCESDCYSYIFVASDDTETAKHGCLDDLDLSDTSYAGTKSCTDEYLSGSCTDAGDEEECLRCCDSDNCNDYTRDTVIAKPDTTTQSASGVMPSLMLIVAAWFLSKHC